MIDIQDNFLGYFDVAVWYRITYDKENKPR